MDYRAVEVAVEEAAAVEPPCEAAGSMRTVGVEVALRSTAQLVAHTRLHSEQSESQRAIYTSNAAGDSAVARTTMATITLNFHMTPQFLAQMAGCLPHRTTRCCNLKRSTFRPQIKSDPRASAQRE